MMEEGEIDLEDNNQQPEAPRNERTKPRREPRPKPKDWLSSIKEDPVRMKYLRESLKQFTLLKKNVYLDRKRKQPKNDELECCLCIPMSDENRVNEHSNVSYNCLDRCLNRMISTECDDETCRCGDLCQNRKFQKHEYACVYPFPSGGKGWGLCAGDKIKKGQFIMQYIGEIFSINSEEGKRRVKEYSSSTCTYLMKTSKGEVIDPTYKGNLARFINHSCEPNCITQKWNVLGEICIGIFALRDLEQNEELTFDYQFDVFNTPLTKCLCGSKKCKGYLGLRPTDITAEEWDERLRDMTCEICNKNYDDDDVKLIICDSCNLGFHMYCLDPPRQDIPEEAFYCVSCIEEKERQKQRLEKEQKQKMKEKKTIALKDLKKLQQNNDDDGLATTAQYERVFRFMREQEEIANKQLFLDDEDDEEIVVKRKEPAAPTSAKSESDREEPSPEKIKTIQKNVTPRKKDETSDIYRRAVDKFQFYLNSHPKLLQELNNFVIDKSIQKKKTMLMNKIQMHLVKSNFILFEKIGAVIFWDHNTKNFNDVFLKNIELSVMGTEKQIEMFQEIVSVTHEIFGQLQTEMGITEAIIAIPAIFLKKFIGAGHHLINQMERTYTVSIFYHRRFINDQCYSLDVQTKLLMKGAKDNIIRAYEEIKKRIASFQIERVYLNPYQIKTILNNMSSLKRKPGMAEFRVNREAPFKDVNHPFYFIQQKNKEITLIGTRPEIEKARKQIFSFFEEPNRKEEFNFNISLFLAPLNFKQNLVSVKNSLEREVPSIKMMIFEPTPPRKNMTISFLGNRDNRQKAREFLFKKLQQLYKENKISHQFDSFQDQMNFQMTKYYFKYMQNTLLTRDSAFMKGWDILNGYFYQEEDNYMWKSIRKSLVNDPQTLLYASFVLKDKLIKKIQRETGSHKSMAEEVFELVRQNMVRIINIHQVNNTPSLKNYVPMFDRTEIRRMFKDQFHYISFLREQDREERFSSNVPRLTAGISAGNNGSGTLHTDYHRGQSTITSHLPPLTTSVSVPSSSYTRDYERNSTSYHHPSYSQPHYGSSSYASPAATQLTPLSTYSSNQVSNQYNSSDLSQTKAPLVSSSSPVNKSQETKTTSLPKKRSTSRSRSREKERVMSYFERTLLKKNKNLLALLQEEEKNRQKERDKGKKK